MGGTIPESFFADEDGMPPPRAGLVSGLIDDKFI